MSTVALPIENKHRELDGVLWLATNLVQNGHKVAVGDVSRVKTISETEIKPDFYFTRTPKYSKRKYDFYSSLKENNCHIFALDPEGILSGEDFFDQRISNEKMLDVYDELLLPGEGAKSSIIKNSEFPENNIHVVGNPRFDLLQPDLRYFYTVKNKDIKSCFGDYILINTNFANVNHNSDPYNPDDRSYIKYDRLSDVKYQGELLELFVEMATKLSRHNQNKEIIIRPHPGEDHQYYLNHTENYSNINIIQRGDVRNWIVGADVVIHNNCTTGIESALLNIPTIAYQPDINDIPSSMSNKMSIVVNTLDELVNSVNNMSDSDYTLSNGQLNELSKYIANTNIKASSKIVELVNTCSKTDGRKTYSTSAAQKFLIYMKNQPFSPYINTLARTVNGKSKHKKKKFSGLSESEVYEKVNRMVHETDFVVEKINNYDCVFWMNKT